jgi:hypothetical protein
MMNQKQFRFFINLSCIMLFSSVVVDLTLWFLCGFMIPSWTIALTSLIIILLLQFIKTEV